MVQLWGRISSINVRKVVWAAQELGLAFQRLDAGGPFGIVKDAAYLQKNPNALVPLLEDEGTLLWESNVIVRYLCAKHGAPTLVASRTALPAEGAVPGLGRPGASAHSMGQIYPTSLPQRFAAEQWMDWQQTTFNPAGRNAFVQLIRTPADQRQPDLIAQSVAATEPLLAMLDAHLAQQPFVGGEHFGMADIPLGCEMHRWLGLPQPRPANNPTPHLDRWYAALRARPAAHGVLDLPLA